MYLIYGESFRLMEEEIKKIVGEEKNIITLDLNECTLDEVINEANYVSLFQDKKIIIVKNAIFFTTVKNSIDVDALLNYLDKPNNLTTIIFTTYEKIDARKKIYKEFSKKYKVIKNELILGDLTIKVRDLFIKNKYKINNEALNYLLSSCKNNYDLIYNECQKIFLYYLEPVELNIDNIKDIVAKSLEDNNFKFVDAVVNRNYPLVSSILEDLYTLKVDPIALIMLLTREYRLMLSSYQLLETGFRKNEVYQKLGLQDWQFKKIEKEMSLYYEDELKDILINLANIDYEIKSGLTDRFMALKKFILTI